MIGKTNEKSWGYKQKRDRTEQGNKVKKEHPHELVGKKARWNKKKGIREMSKKSSKEIISVRCD